MAIPQVSAGKFNVRDLASRHTQKKVCVIQLLLKFIANESGATAIEYGLIAACISVAIITVLSTVGSSLNGTFTSVATTLK